MLVIQLLCKTGSLASVDTYWFAFWDGETLRVPLWCCWQRVFFHPNSTRPSPPTRPLLKTTSCLPKWLASFLPGIPKTIPPPMVVPLFLASFSLLVDFQGRSRHLFSRVLLSQSRHRRLFKKPQSNAHRENLGTTSTIHQNV